MKVKKMSIISFNVQGTPSSSAKTYYRLNKIAEILNSEDVDIVNLQEVFTYKHLSVLRNRLQNFRYCALEKFVIGPKGGLVTFSKIPIKKKKYIPYPSKLSKSNLIRSFLRNILTGKGILINRIKNSSIFIVNTHLTVALSSDWPKVSSHHKKQIAKLSNSINSIKDYDLLILSGDFNIPKKSYLYKELLTKLEARDVFQNYNFPTFHKEFLPKHERGNRLDYLLVKTNKTKFRVTNKEHIFTKKLIQKDINRGFVSDHIGLKTTLEFN